MAAACERTGVAPPHTDDATIAGHVANGTDVLRGGRRLSDHADGGGLSGPTSREPGEGNTNRHLRLLATPPVSVVSYGELRELVKARIRRECRRWGFDWDAFIADRPEWGIVEVVHRKAVQDAARRGLDVRPTDVPTDTVLKAVKAILEEMDADPALRPSEAGFRAEQARRGELGRIKQAETARQRDAEVAELLARGITNQAEIGRRLGISPSKMSRICKRLKAAPPLVVETPAEAPACERHFPAPEIPRGERWPAVQFMKQTGVLLDADQARWLADMGRCYEAEGRENDLMASIGSSAGEGVRDPWAYLQRCVVNRGDAWTVSPQLLADVLSWAGQKSLEYALVAIGGDYVRRPLPYLRKVLADAVASGRRPDGWPERPVAMAVGMARQWAPELVIVAADDAVVNEEVDRRTSNLDSFRRRFGRLPWEPEPDVGPDIVDAADCCIGLNRVPLDEFKLLDQLAKKLNSSPSTHKADAMLLMTGRLYLGVGPGSPLGPSNGRVPSRPPSRSDELEQAPKTADTGNSGGIRCPESDGEALKSGGMTCAPLPRQNRTGILEHGPCRHPLAALMSTAMVLDDVVEVECAAGCGHRLYSDRGPVECPCHWPPAKAAQVVHELQREPTAVRPLPNGRSAYADVRTTHGP